jgi:hypothetical protein
MTDRTSTFSATRVARTLQLPAGGNVIRLVGMLVAVATLCGLAEAAPIAPVVSPFAYNVGINYETFNTTNVPADLAEITKNFSLIRIYRAAAVGTSNPENPIIDPAAGQVIKYVAANDSLQLVIGTNNSALAQGGFGFPWRAGLMTDPNYTNKWAEMLVSAFGSVDKAKRHLRAVLLGNEVDANGPPPDNSSFSDYYQNWIPRSFDNLKVSLNAVGLENIPISTTIANYPMGYPPPKAPPSDVNVVAQHTTEYINQNWSTDWNGNKPFVLYNQYTLNFGMSTDFGPVATYFENLAALLNNSPQVFVGETGYNAKFGDANQAKVIAAIFQWLEQQRNSVGSTVPLFVFMAYDDPAQGDFGIYRRDPYGLKPGITVPSWVNVPKP